MGAGQIRLEDPLARRLAERVRQLGPLGSLSVDAVELDAAAERALDRLAERLVNSYPYGEPHYVGQMLKPPHPIAWAAYATTMLLNPNNHALDGGPATAAMEREAVAAIAAMFGYGEPLGHLTSSGTIANLEALWVARELAPERAILVGENAHYTHERMCAVIGARVEPVVQDDRGRIDLEALERRLRAGGVGTVVATLGTTSLGAVDPVHAIADLCAAHGARLHVDAAYGGFHTLLADGGRPGVEATHFAALHRADSIVVDPHKHGLQPYGCGCVLFADPGVGRLYAHDSPYTYFTSSELHLGEISLECSRAGAAAAALWATLEALPLSRDGPRRAARAGARRGAAPRRRARRRARTSRSSSRRSSTSSARSPRSARASQISAACERAFDALAHDGWHAAKLRIATSWLRRRHPTIADDAAQVTTLRLVLMKPEHLGVVDELALALEASLAPAP